MIAFMPPLALHTESRKEDECQSEFQVLLCQHPVDLILSYVESSARQNVGASDRWFDRASLGKERDLVCPNDIASNGPIYFLSAIIGYTDCTAAPP